MEKEILAYKGFSESLKCRGYQFEIGKAFEHVGEVLVCESGFHACENPLDVFNYYQVVGSRFAIVKCSGEISKKENGDSIIACGKLVVEAEIKLPEVIKKGVDWILSKVDFDDKKNKDMDKSTAVADGEWSISAAVGYEATSIANGYGAKSVADGYGANASSNGAGQRLSLWEIIQQPKYQESIQLPVL